jgi:hypothetical protein
MQAGLESEAADAAGARRGGSAEALIAALMLASTAGCAAGQNDAGPAKPAAAQRTAEPPAVAPSKQPGADMPTQARTPALEAQVQAALADAARRTGLDAGALEVASAQAVTWSDGSLGCPEPGMLYTQALVPGYRIRIVAGERTLDYHAGLRGAPRLCPAGRSRDPLPGGSRI